MITTRSIAELPSPLPQLMTTEDSSGQNDNRRSFEGVGFNAHPLRNYVNIECRRSIVYQKKFFEFELQPARLKRN